MLKRKIAAVFTAFLTAASAIIPQLEPLNIFASEEDVLAGDLNLDGKTGLQDVSLLQKYLLGTSSLTSGQYDNADLNGNGSVDIFDLVLLRRTVSKAAQKYSSLLINEVCSTNKNSLKDAAGASPDWIEIYNSSDEEIALDGIGVSDGAKNKFKFAFPENTAIPAKGYVLVLCDDAVNQSEGEYQDRKSVV